MIDLSGVVNHFGLIKIANELIGKPFLWHARGPDAFDCLGLVLYVYKHALHNELPDPASTNPLHVSGSPLADKFKRIFTDTGDAVKDGDVLVWPVTADLRGHLGIYLDRQILHAVEGKGVLLERCSSFRMNELNTYRHKNFFRGLRRENMIHNGEIAK